jgi:hypothetical protein
MCNRRVSQCRTLLVDQSHSVQPDTCCTLAQKSDVNGAAAAVVGWTLHLIESEDAALHPSRIKTGRCRGVTARRASYSDKLRSADVYWALRIDLRAGGAAGLNERRTKA